MYKMVIRSIMLYEDEDETKITKTWKKDGGRWNDNTEVFEWLEIGK